MKALMTFAVLILVASAPGAQAQTPTVPVQHWDSAGDYFGESVALGMSTSGEWYVLFEAQDEGLIRWAPYQGTFEPLAISVTAIGARGPNVTVAETTELGPFIIHSIRRFEIDAVDPSSAAVFSRSSPAEEIRGDHTGYARWIEGGTVFLWPNGGSIESFATAYPGNAPTRGDMTHHGVFPAFFEEPDGQGGWVVDAVNAIGGPYRQLVEPQLDLFPGTHMPNVVHRGSLQSLQRRQSDFPYDTKGEWDLSSLCTSVHRPQGGGYVTDLFGRLAVFHGQGCIDGASVLYAISLATDDVYFIDEVPAQPRFEVFEEAMAYVDGRGMTHFVHFDMAAFPEDPYPTP